MNHLTWVIRLDLKKHIREVKDFPKKGILFYDITTLLQNHESLQGSIDQLYDLVKDKKIDKVTAIESRGFIFAVPLALKLGVGFAMIRKPGKLPYDKIEESYDLEYGSNTIEIHNDAIKQGENVLVVDDLLATGGTAKAACNLVEKLGGKVASMLFLVELTFLKGRDKLKNYPVLSLINYDK